MAKITASPLVGSVRGAVGGVVFRGSGASATVQPFPVRKRSLSAMQTVQRQAVAEASRRWAEMEARARDTWEEYAFENLPPSGAAGQPIATGKAAWTQFRVAQYLCGRLSDYWWPASWPYSSEIQPVYLANAAPAPTFDLAVLFGGGVVGCNVAAARCSRLDRYSSRPLYRSLFCGAVDGSPPWEFDPGTPATPWHLDLSAAFAAAFPTIQAGDLLQVRAQFATYTAFHSPASLSIIAVA